MSTPPLRKTIRNGDARSANFWSDAPPFSGLAGTGMPNEPASLDTLGETLYPLFCVDHAWIRRVGDGEVLGVVLVVFGFGGGAGCVVVVRGAKSLVAAAWFIL